MTVNETLFYLAGRYLDLNKSCHFTLLCFAFLFPSFSTRPFCINPPDGGRAELGQWAGLTDSTQPPPSWRRNLFMSKPISKKHSDSVQSEKRRTWFFIVIIILFVMVIIIMYNVKFFLFYFFFMELSFTIFGNCFLWTKSPIPVY